MVAPVPQEEINVVIKEVVDLAKSGLYNELEARRLEKRTLGLLSAHTADPALCHMALSILYLIGGKREECASAVRSAVALAPKQAVIMKNAINTLTPNGNVREAYLLSRRIPELFPDNLGVLACGILNALHCFQFSYGLELADRYTKLSVNKENDSMDEVINQLIKNQKAAKAYGMSEDEMLKRLEVAVETLQSFGHTTRQTSIHALGDGTFVYEIYIDADRKACANLNFDIAESLFEKFDDSGVDIFSLVCRPASDFPSKTATLVAPA